MKSVLLDNRTPKGSWCRHLNMRRIKAALHRSTVAVG